MSTTARSRPSPATTSTVEVDGLRIQGLLPGERQRGNRWSASTPRAATTTSGAACSRTRRSPRTTGSSPTTCPATASPIHRRTRSGGRRSTSWPRTTTPISSWRSADALELEDPIFMGSSFGGNETLQLALHHPDRFAGAMAVEAADYSPGLLPGLVATPARERRAGVRHGGLGLDVPAVAEAERWTTWFYYTPGRRIVQGRPLLLLGRPRSARGSSARSTGSMPLVHADR